MATYNEGDLVLISIGEISRTVARSRGISPDEEQTAQVTGIVTQRTLLGEVELYNLTVQESGMDELTLSSVREERIRGLA